MIKPINGQLGIKQISFFAYYHSRHAKHSVNNYVVGELQRYARFNTKEKNFWASKLDLWTFWTEGSKDGNSLVCSTK